MERSPVHTTRVTFQQMLDLRQDKHIRMIRPLDIVIQVNIQHHKVHTYRDI